MRHTDNGVMRINLGDVTQRWGGFNLEDDKNSLYLPRYWKNWFNRIVVRAHDWNLVAVVADGTRQMAYINGVLQAVKTNQMTTAAGPVEIGLRSAGKGGTNAVGADGDFAELLIYQYAMDAGDRLQVEHYLRDKWFNNQGHSTPSSLVWCNPQMTGLTGFSYSRATGQFLLTKLENGRSSLWRFDPATNDPTPIAEAVNIVSPQWLGGNGYGYGGFNAGTNAVVLEAARGGQKSTLPVPGNLRWFQATPEGDKLLILGTFSNEPAEAIWQYDLAAGTLRPLVPGSDHPSALAQNLEPSQTTLRLPSGRNVRCTLYTPPHLDAHKKYPLVLGYTHFGTFADGAFGRMWLPALAACGAYVVVVDRASWDGGIENWGENVGGAYQTLIQNPRIDASRVYLFAASKETHYLSEFVTQAPRRWRGLILLNPSELPDFAGNPRREPKPKVLISAGAEEHEEARLSNYQDDSLKSGVVVETEVAAGESHMFVGNLAQLERTRAMMHFIFEE
jgi:dipeptidyl aminopeptidase/acylaminoacyl peptidase